LYKIINTNEYWFKICRPDIQELEQIEERICKYADDNASEFSYLDRRTLVSLDSEKLITDMIPLKDANSNYGYYGLRIDFIKPMQSVIFKFSNGLDVHRFIDDVDYMSRCEFHYWENFTDANIRFGRPYIDFISETSLIKK
jgi:hypothetical protein